ncbi:uncharacterized protein LOC119397714 [Rhipicephalus sanguineus]|uniref:uncharacterized protein LOC119397714 n=1 Tax=Rhipicephalus sanguineus TaxID=34632 RepID=UPI0020C48E9B|nr:uncharacterized protein LOC119397714 [Rhipicephalus sanguineus]
MACSQETFASELDAAASNEDVDVLRVALGTDGDAYAWLTEYSEATKTSWIVDWEIADPKRFVFHKKWRCQHSSINKTVGRNSTNCPAFVDVKIKKVTKHTKRNDAFLRRDVPLTALIKLNENHNHVLDCAHGLHLLKSTADTRATFVQYFRNGLGPAAALDFHRSKLGNQENGARLLANSSYNPRPGTLYHWFRIWRKTNHGDNTDPLTKLAEKMPAYTQRRVDVKTSKSQDDSCWAVLVVTPIMRRTQALDAAREIVFLDSTASCDDSQTNVTVVLVATPVGALPIAVLLHSAQSTESYSRAFSLLKQNYPLCFGGAHAPQTFMTDNFAAEKAALCATWPESKQLLCHFHVAQAEWRWLQASRNNVSRDERRELMTAFQRGG